MERLALLGTPIEVSNEDGTASTVIGYRLTLTYHLRVTEVLTVDGSIPATPAALDALRKAGAL